VFCLPSVKEAGRQNQEIRVYVCRQSKKQADKIKKFVYMSAASQRSRQTKARYSCTCLPPVKETGRQIQDYPVYICRQSMSQADKSKISLLKLPAKKIEAVFQNSPYGKIYLSAGKQAEAQKGRGPWRI
jgi:hypothetical protein